MLITDVIDSTWVAIHDEVKDLTVFVSEKKEGDKVVDYTVLCSRPSQRDKVAKYLPHVNLPMEGEPLWFLTMMCVEFGVYDITPEGSDKLIEWAKHTKEVQEQARAVA